MNLQLSLETNNIYENDKSEIPLSDLLGGPRKNGLIEDNLIIPNDPNLSHINSYFSFKHQQINVENTNPEVGTSGISGDSEKNREDKMSLILSDDPYLCKGSSMHLCNFICLSRNLSEHPSYINSPPSYRIVLLEILFRAAWKPTQLDHKGHVFQIEAGQLWVSIRQLLKWCGKGVDKNVVERAISKFCLVGFVRQEVRHTKLLITITMSELWSNKINEYETGSETKVRHFRDTKEQYNKITKDIGSKDPTAPIVQARRSKVKNLDSLKYSFEKQTFIGICEKDLQDWKDAYPSIDLSREIAACVQWIKTNPKKCGKRILWRKFLTTIWFSNAQDRAMRNAALNSMKTSPQISSNQSIDRRQKNKDGSLANGGEDLF